ncbi:MAG: sugar phosphate isomerase/epimerase family protein [Chloroflexota bacterium]
MQVSIVSDEISADLETALELGIEWGVTHFELRGYGAQRVPLYSDYQKQRVKELLEEHECKIAAISPGLFKLPYPANRRERFPLSSIDSVLYQRWHDARSLVQYQLEELLPASIEYALEVGTSKIVIFSFERGAKPSEGIPDEILNTLQTAAILARKNGVQLVVEVEHEHWADSGRHAAQLVQAVADPGLAVNWDPGNAIVSGEQPYPEGYACVRDHVRHVHFKDVVYSRETGFQYRVAGMIDWAGQLQALAADGYSGYVSVEPHMRPKVASVRAAVERLLHLIREIPDNLSFENKIAAHERGE